MSDKQVFYPGQRVKYNNNNNREGTIVWSDSELSVIHFDQSNSDQFASKDYIYNNAPAKAVIEYALKHNIVSVLKVFRGVPTKNLTPLPEEQTMPQAASNISSVSFQYGDRVKWLNSSGQERFGTVVYHGLGKRDLVVAPDYLSDCGEYLCDKDNVGKIDQSINKYLQDNNLSNIKRFAVLECARLISIAKKYKYGERVIYKDKPATVLFDYSGENVGDDGSLLIMEDSEPLQALCKSRKEDFTYACSHQAINRYCAEHGEASKKKLFSVVSKSAVSDIVKVPSEVDIVKTSQPESETHTTHKFQPGDRVNYKGVNGTVVGYLVNSAIHNPLIHWDKFHSSGSEGRLYSASEYSAYRKLAEQYIQKYGYTNSDKIFDRSIDDVAIQRGEIKPKVNFKPGDRIKSRAYGLGRIVGYMPSEKYPSGYLVAYDRTDVGFANCLEGLPDYREEIKAYALKYSLDPKANHFLLQEADFEDFELVSEPSTSYVQYQYGDRIIWIDWAGTKQFGTVVYHISGNNVLVVATDNVVAGACSSDSIWNSEVIPSVNKFAKENHYQNNDKIFLSLPATSVQSLPKTFQYDEQVLYNGQPATVIFDYTGEQTLNDDHLNDDSVLILEHNEKPSANYAYPGSTFSFPLHRQAINRYCAAHNKSITDTRFSIVPRTSLVKTTPKTMPTAQSLTIHKFQPGARVTFNGISGTVVGYLNTLTDQKYPLIHWEKSPIGGNLSSANGYGFDGYRSLAEQYCNQNSLSSNDLLFLCGLHEDQLQRNVDFQPGDRIKHKECGIGRIVKKMSAGYLVVYDQVHHHNASCLSGLSEYREDIKAYAQKHSIDPNARHFFWETILDSLELATAAETVSAPVYQDHNHDFKLTDGTIAKLGAEVNSFSRNGIIVGRHTDATYTFVVFDQSLNMPCRARDVLKEYEFTSPKQQEEIQTLLKQLAEKFGVSVDKLKIGCVLTDMMTPPVPSTTTTAPGTFVGKNGETIRLGDEVNVYDRYEAVVIGKVNIKDGEASKVRVLTTSSFKSNDGYHTGLHLSLEDTKDPIINAAIQKFGVPVADLRIAEPFQAGISKASAPISNDSNSKLKEISSLVSNDKQAEKYTSRIVYHSDRTGKALALGDEVETSYGGNKGFIVGLYELPIPPNDDIAVCIVGNNSKSDLDFIKRKRPEFLPAIQELSVKLQKPIESLKFSFYSFDAVKKIQENNSMTSQFNKGDWVASPKNGIPHGRIIAVDKTGKQKLMCFEEIPGRIDGASLSSMDRAYVRTQEGTFVNDLINYASIVRPGGGLNFMRCTWVYDHELAKIDPATIKSNFVPPSSPPTAQTPASTTTDQKSKTPGLRQDVSKAAYRVGVNRLNQAVHKLVVDGLICRGASEHEIGMVSSFLKSEYGVAVIGMLLGLGLPNLPKYGSDQRVQELSKEFRIQALTSAGNEALSGLFNSISDIIAENVRSLPEESCREATDDAAIEEALEEESLEADYAMA